MSCTVAARRVKAKADWTSDERRHWIMPRLSEKTRPSQRLLVVALCALWFAVSVEAQRRAVRGRITDATDAPVPGITVTLVLDGQDERTVTTNPDGAFNFDIVDLSRGAFKVRF